MRMCAEDGRAQEMTDAKNYHFRMVWLAHAFIVDERTMRIDNVQPNNSKQWMFKIASYISPAAHTKIILWPYSIHICDKGRFAYTHTHIHTRSHIVADQLYTLRAHTHLWCVLCKAIKVYNKFLFLLLLSMFVRVKYESNSISIVLQMKLKS